MGKAHPNTARLWTSPIVPVAWLLARSRLIELHSAEFLIAATVLTWLLLSVVLMAVLTVLKSLARNRVQGSAASSGR
jgi:hypothetical protein